MMYTSDTYEVNTQSHTFMVDETQEKQLRLENNTVHYFDEGKGDCIVLLHGWLGGKVVYKPLIKELKKDFRIIAPDVFGYGDVWRNDKTFFHTQAVVVLQLLDKLKVSNFQLFGNSLGGGLCIEIAELSPTRVEKLILRVPFISYKQLPLPARTSVLKSAFSYLVSKSTIQRALRPTIRSLLIRELFPEGSLYRNFKSEVLDELDKRADSKLSTAYITEAFYLDYESILNSLYMPITILETPVDNVLSKNYSSLLIDSISRILIPNSQHGLLSLDQKMLATMITKILKN